ncbi:amino acid ABC transporter permease [Pseudoflavonifractor sp. DSM 107456]|uniref:Amino acid ABC transporter permease n=3 Tax=Clostridia TaxID=186801 RepID=A0ABR9RDY0_9FIRM|nr:amino acid ABC transporter permease [Pseudoflavonifractor hominis]MBE5056914.1 amino acid ABC transporter permease [Pseudoflavonifractor gallinarum]MBT9683798.1 ABC transporter permease subunit [Pseudoflavonifractor sp. MCC625]
MVEVFPTLLDATKVTLFLSVLALVLAFALALVLAFIRYFKIAILSPLVQLYVSFFRGTPLITQLFLVYFGIFTLNQFLTKLSPTYAVVVTLALNSGAYMSETIRASFASVDQGQIEAAESLCMSKLQYMRRIVFPQAMRVALPSLFNSLIDLIKGTSIAFTIGVTEMMACGIYEGSRQFNFFEIYLDVAIIYWILSIILSFLQRKLEKALNVYQ